MVGVVGLGSIGGHIARALATAGRRVVGFDVREQAHEEFPEAERAASPLAVGEESDVVLVAVYDDEQLREVLTGADGIFHAKARPAAVCVLATITLATLRWAAEQAAQAGVELLDCGVTGGSGLRTRGQIVVLAGGSAEALERVRPTLEVFAAPLLHMGPLPVPGCRRSSRGTSCTTAGGTPPREAARIADACGIDIDKLVEAHTVSNQSGRRARRAS